MEKIERVVIGIFLVFTCGLLLLAYAKDASAEGVNVGPNCRIQWNASTGRVSGYRVFVGTSAEDKTQRAEVTSTAVPCADVEATEGQQYVHVTAFNEGGESGPSATVPFFVTSAPSTPTGLVVLP